GLVLVVFLFFLGEGSLRMHPGGSGPCFTRLRVELYWISFVVFLELPTAFVRLLWCAAQSCNPLFLLLYIFREWNIASRNLWCGLGRSHERLAVYGQRSN